MNKNSSANQHEFNEPIVANKGYGYGSCWGVAGESGASVKGEPLCGSDCSMNATPVPSKAAAAS